MRIIQLVNGYSKGDGVGNVITAIDSLLKQQGYSTEIYNQTLNYKDLNNKDFMEDNILLYHVALSVDPLVPYLRCKKILVFHNITDPDLLIGSGFQQMKNWCSAGLYDVGRISEYFQGAIVFSNYSKNTLVEMGWNAEKIYEIPIMVRFENLAREYSKKVMEEYVDGYTNIIFTGRVFPNKKQEDIIYTFSEYHEHFNKQSRLFIVGSVGNNNYFNALKGLVNKLKLENSVIFTGRVPFDEYLAYYHLADVFLCMSAHEGFCIPLVEALYFHVPVIAINSTAIPDTLNGCGVIMDSRDPEKVAVEINKVVRDRDYRNQIIAGESFRLAELQSEVVSKQYLAVLKKCLDIRSEDVKRKHLSDRFLLIEGISIPEKLKRKDEINIIYGFGAAGHRLLSFMNENNILISEVCDRGKRGTVESQINIKDPEDILKSYPSANYIISIQEKRIIRNVICMMKDVGIVSDNIYIFDEMNATIV